MSFIQTPAPLSEAVQTYEAALTSIPSATITKTPTITLTPSKNSPGHTDAFAYVYAVHHLDTFDHTHTVQYADHYPHGADADAHDHPYRANPHTDIHPQPDEYPLKVILDLRTRNWRYFPGISFSGASGFTTCFTHYPLSS